MNRKNKKIANGGCNNKKQNKTNKKKTSWIGSVDGEKWVISKCQYHDYGDHKVITIRPLFSEQIVWLIVTLPLAMSLYLLTREQRTEHFLYGWQKCHVYQNEDKKKNLKQTEKWKCSKLNFRKKKINAKINKKKNRNLLKENVCV